MKPSRVSSNAGVLRDPKCPFERTSMHPKSEAMEGMILAGSEADFDRQLNRPKIRRNAWGIGKEHVDVPQDVGMCLA